MHLSLNGWPPVASHVASLLLGVSLAHLSWRDEPALHLPGRSIVLSLPPSAAKGLALAELTRGSRVHLLKPRAGAPTCRLSREPLQLLGRLPAPLVGLSLGAASELAAIAREAKLDTLILREATVGAQVALCTAKPKVTYGAQ